MNTIERNDLISRHLSFAEALAKKKYRTAPSGIELSDLISAAYFGLVQAANKFDINKGGSFTTYAFYRINGEMYSFIGSELQARHKSVSIDATDAQGACLKDVIEDKHHSSIEEIIEPLNPVGKQLIMWYYEDRLSMKEIGVKMGVQQPCVSKLLHYYTMQLAA